MYKSIASLHKKIIEVKTYVKNQIKILILSVANNVTDQIKIATVDIFDTAANLITSVTTDLDNALKNIQIIDNCLELIVSSTESDKVSV